MASIKNSWITYSTGRQRIDPMPDDAEEKDKEEIKLIVEKYMSKKYPPVENGLVHTFDKDYYLPALKVLDRRDGKYFSPSREAEWVDMELEAECKEGVYSFSISYTLGGQTKILPDQKPRHPAPHPDCDCGIYGSVNMEEVASYLFEINTPSFHKAMMNVFYSPQQEQNETEKVLCIIEPSEDAEVIICRKGWKASKAFISEIIGETIHPHEASQILSMAWNRNINVGEIYENRRER